MKTFDEILTEFRREMMGASVAHMTDAELGDWFQQFEDPLPALPGSAELPAWFVKRRNEARVQLLRLLRSRIGLK